jgi:SOS response regulatory protein OraA/RecX
MTKMEKENLRAYLYRLLTKRPCTRKEAEDRLVARGAGSAEALDLVSEFAALGMIDDASWARLFAEGHESWGEARLRYEMERRGVDEKTIALTLVESGDEREKARPLVENWIARGVEWEKIAARLCRRGFSARTVRSFRQDDVEW